MRKVLSIPIIVLLLISLSPCGLADEAYDKEFYNEMAVEIIESEFLDGSTIYGFDVDNEGNCLLMTRKVRDWYINIYSSEGTFQYCIHFLSKYDYCQAFYDENDRISILFVKEDLVAALDKDGNLLMLYTDEDRKIERSLPDFFVEGEASEYVIEKNGSVYTLSIPGYWERTIHHGKRTLKIVTGDGNHIVVYETGNAGNSSERYSWLFPVILAIAVIVILIIMKKTIVRFRTGSDSSS